MNTIQEEMKTFPRETFNANDVYSLERVRSRIIRIMIKYNGDDPHLESLLSDALLSCGILRSVIEEGIVRENSHD